MGSVGIGAFCDGERFHYVEIVMNRIAVIEPVRKTMSSLLLEIRGSLAEGYGEWGVLKATVSGPTSMEIPPWNITQNDGAFVIQFPFEIVK